MSFWKIVCKDNCVRDLMLKYSSDIYKKENRRSSIGCGGSRSKVEQGSDRLRALKEQASRELEEATVPPEDASIVGSPSTFPTTAEEDLFAVGARLGTRDLPGQRVLQVATIVRNLSFEEDNAAVLARNPTLLRFCLLCCSSKWSNLNQMGFDILGNVASEVVLQGADESCITDVMLSTLATSIGSTDRFQVISSLDVLNKLAQQEANEDFLGEVLSDENGGGGEGGIYERLAAYLTLHDIHLLISTLECLYSLSSLGEPACSAIARTHGALDSLVSLVTVEAQSYGPKACILMRVVETVPGASSLAAAGGLQHQVVQAGQVQSIRPIVQQQRPQQVAILSGGQVVQISKAPQQQAAATTAAPTVQPGAQQAQVSTTTTAAPAGATRQVVVTSGGQQVTQMVRIQPQPQGQQQTISQPAPQQQQQQPLQQPQQQQQPQPAQAQPQTASQQVQLRVCNDESNRNFCLSWLRATYEAVTGCSIQHEIMYKQYLASLHKLGKRDVISAQHYAACVR